MTPSVRALEAAAQLLRMMITAGAHSWSVDRLTREARRSGLSGPPTPETLRVLECSGLVQPVGDVMLVTREGKRIGESLGQSWREYCLCMLAMPWAAQQAAKVMHVFNRTDEGLKCERSRAGVLAPQLTVVLAWLRQGVGSTLVVDAEVEERLFAALHLTDQPISLPSWVAAAAAVGHRAELYSLHFERSRKAPSVILHVAAETDRLGYDIEDRSTTPPTLIEVKGSTGSLVRFFLSDNELTVATTHQADYVVQFWGTIDPSRSMGDEYAALTAAGYPLVLRDPAGQIRRGEILASPSEWRVTLGAEPPPQQSEAAP